MKVSFFPVAAYPIFQKQISIYFRNKWTQQLIAIGSRLLAFQRVIYEVRTLPLTPQRVTQKANLSFKNKFPHISVIDEASDFKLGMQLEFPKGHHQIPPEEKVDVASG